MLPQRQQIPGNANDANVSGLLNTAQPCRRRPGAGAAALGAFLGAFRWCCGRATSATASFIQTNCSVGSWLSFDIEGVVALYCTRHERKRYGNPSGRASHRRL